MKTHTCCCHCDNTQLLPTPTVTLPNVLRAVAQHLEEMSDYFDNAPETYEEPYQLNGEFLAMHTERLAKDLIRFDQREMALSLAKTSGCELRL